MANPDHIALLVKGRTAWKAWREENRNTRPDLSGADLSGADLVLANLFDAHLLGGNP
jgi:uncharacterized protein YjbI with pentapeptide repeats